ncbi:MAG: MFS transporter [Deltaproteobacteria bacterium]|nr:MFS transporter [Deltaproteobacteria bacterium]
MLNRVFYGWWVVLATSVIHLWGAGTFYYSFTAFFNPIVEEFGWSYAATSFAASIRSIEGGIASPIVGFAADRFGARRLLFVGSILTGLGFILLSQIHSLWSFYLLFVFLSIGSSLLFPVPGWTAVANWFLKKRGTAFGIMSGAIGLGGGMIYLANVLINLYGWRLTLVFTGFGTWVIGIPLSLFVRHRPEPYGLLPDGEVPMKAVQDPVEDADKGAPGVAEGFTLREAWRTRAFWGIALVVTVSAATVHAIIVHVMPYLISVDFSREGASLIASSLVFISITGRFGLGWLSNRFDDRYLLAAGMMLQALGLIFLTGAGDILWAALFIVIFGPAYGGVLTLRLTIQAKYFGSRAFGSIQGTLMAIMIIGSMSSPLLTGRCYDIYGDYRLAWLVLAAANVAVVPLALKIRRPRVDRGTP